MHKQQNKDEEADADAALPLSHLLIAKDSALYFFIIKRKENHKYHILNKHEIIKYYNSI